MAGTNFDNGVSSYGMPLFGSNGTIPTMGRDAKVFFVDPARGSDGNSGLSMKRPLDTVSKAEDLADDKSGDVIYLLNDGNTSGTSREETTITWDKDNVHLVGLCAPGVNQRARISPTAATTAVSPQLTVSGNGNVFSNFALVEGNTTAADSTGLSVSGLRNLFSNVSVLNMLGNTSGDARTRAGSECLLLSGEENTFSHCTIGTDTTARSAANANVRTAATATRNRFEDCVFGMHTSAATPLFLDVPTGTLDRWLLFVRCMFINAVGSTATELATAFTVHASAGGMVVLQDSYVAGAVEWEVGGAGNVYAGMPTSTVTGITAGGLVDVVTT